jgi:hypothetical protein
MSVVAAEEASAVDDRDDDHDDSESETDAPAPSTNNQARWFFILGGLLLPLS